MNKLEAKRAEVFAKNYRQYLGRLSEIDLGARAGVLDIVLENGAAQIPFFGTRYWVTPEKITDESGAQAPYDACVVLARYLLMCPKRLPTDDAWTAYRDFKDSGPLTVFFADTVEGAIASAFTGRRALLDGAVKALGGRPPLISLSYDLSLQIPALPRVPLLLLFNDADEDFPAQCSVLFEARADRYLDAESLAVLGSHLVHRLKSHG
ncbi:MAG: DUF3786 domain-containing protein [Desulfobacterales bacterium]|nr:DUF3786 domain-containing protein [Desulfobacterales bacterium]